MVELRHFKKPDPTILAFFSLDFGCLYGNVKIDLVSAALYQLVPRLNYFDHEVHQKPSIINKLIIRFLQIGTCGVPDHAAPFDLYQL